MCYVSIKWHIAHIFHIFYIFYIFYRKEEVTMARNAEELLKMQKQYDNSIEWNEAGWTGLGISVWDMENYERWHGRMTTLRIKQAAPDANIITISHHGKYSNGDVIEESVEGYGSAADFIEAENIKVCTVSIGGYNGISSKNFYTGLRNKYNLIMFNSAGNEGSEGVSTSDSKSFIWVGAAQFFSDDKLGMAGYSSIGRKFEDVDFSTFAGSGLAGTSFSTPYLAGLSTLLLQRYGDMSQHEIYQYFKMIAQPIKTDGHWDEEKQYDYKAGWGIPIMPPVGKKLLRLTIDDKNFQIDGEDKKTDVAPFIKDGRTFVPIAFIAEELGAGITWNNQTREVVISKNNKILSMIINKKEYMLNGKPFIMDTAPFIKNNRTCVPLAFVALALDCKVAWVPEDRRVLVLER